MATLDLQVEALPQSAFKIQDHLKAQKNARGAIQGLWYRGVVESGSLALGMGVEWSAPFVDGHSLLVFTFANGRESE